MCQGEKRPESRKTIGIRGSVKQAKAIPPQAEMLLHQLLVHAFSLM